MRNRNKKMKLLKIRCLYLVFVMISVFLCPNQAFGQKVFVSGKTNKINALVRLLAYDEMLSCEQTKIAETYTDEDGRFCLEAEIKEITPAQIAINLERVDFILSPNGKYDVEIFIPEYQADVSFFDREHPTLMINRADDDGLYSQYIDTEQLTSDFLYKNFNQIYRGRKLYLLDSLDNQIVTNVGEIKSDYVKNFIKYKKAAVVMAVNNKKAVSEYFDNQEIMYLQPAYMDAFKELFDGFLKTRDFNQQELQKEFNSGFAGLMSFLQKNDFLSRNQQLCELILMMELKRFYYENTFDKKIILNYYEKIKSTSKYLKNRDVAQNLIKKITALSYDSDAPVFSLKDKNGDMIQLSDYQDDMVLLQFVGHLSPAIEREFAILNEYHKEWKESVKILTITSSESFDDCLQLFDNQGYDWTVLDVGDNILLLEDYHVKIYPAYIILKKKGKIGMAPAPSPEQYLDFHINRIKR